MPPLSLPIKGRNIRESYQPILVGLHNSLIHRYMGAWIELYRMAKKAI